MKSGRLGEITTAICRDDSWSLISCLRRSNASYPEDEILESICLYDAVNCAASLLRRKLNSDPALVLNRPMPGAGPFSPLHYAADFACPRVVELFLSHGARTDIRLHDPLHARGRNGLLPLEIALDVARDHLLERTVYSPGQSTFRLILSLCLPEMKSALKACKLLAWSSENVEKEAYYYAIEGKLTEFAILLMVAREKVLVPITFSYQDGDDWDGIMTLQQCLQKKLVSISDKWLKSPGTLGRKKTTWILKSNAVLRSAALVLEVVERAGNSLEDYLKFEQHGASKEQVERDVASRLVKAGFTLEARDFEVSIRNGMNSCDPASSHTKNQGTPSENRSQPSHPPFSWQQQRNFHPRNGIISGDGYWSSRSTYPLRRAHSLLSMKKSINRSHIPRSTSTCGCQYSTCLDVQANRQTKTMEQGFPQYLPSEKLACISTLMKRGIRSARFLL
ncbi:uncharacterized protein LOC131322805 [Rhododendron vialii]|uniref:uncharacterized protein LOC131322805 n=1 Tax=Rhododendron vialii TaxID=182163 RepID=UPI00265F5368|nr:uncharacterized protein LOC131322805 [Rhododendron vialii]